MISVQKRPFCDSALWHMLLNSWETNFCCCAITTSEFLLYYAAEKFLQFYYLSGRVFVHLRNINILLFCYSASPVAEIFFLWEIFCCSATPVAEFFSSEKFSSILLLHYPSGRIFLIWETFCYSTILLSHSSRIFQPECFSYQWRIQGGKGGANAPPFGGE